MTQGEIALCGPSGVKPRKESGMDLILSSLGAALFMIGFAVFSRALRAPDSSLAILPGLACLAGLAIAAWGTWRIRRRGDDAALMQAGMFGFVFWTGLYEKAPKGSALALFAALLPLVPAALFAWSTVRLVRHADELQRRIALEALAFGFFVSLFTALAGAALEAAGLPRLNWGWLAGVLIVASGVGLALANRRYR